MNPGSSYNALVVDKKETGDTELSVQKLNTGQLPNNDVLIRVHYSSLNFKDALSAKGNPGVTRKFPHTPGIDAAGVVEQSSDSRFRKGDEVIVTSYDLGQNTWGGFGQYISVPGDWVVPLPEGLTLKESMIFGTAGFTAAYGVKKIVDQNVQPDAGEVIVTGATGGVGTMAVAILAHLGYSVIAVTGKSDQHEFLKKIGASKIMDRQEVTDISSKPMLSSRWVAGVDTVGGEMLDAVLRQTAHNGVITCCGNVLGGELDTSIYPFILRGVSLMGIDSGICLMEDRIEIWNKLATDWKIDSLDYLHREIKLEQLPAEIDKIIDGKQVGRILVNLRS